MGCRQRKNAPTILPATGPRALDEVPAAAPLVSPAVLGSKAPQAPARAPAKHAK